MFQFPRCPPRGLCIPPPVSSHHEREVPPFGHPRIKACVRLPGAFRCSPRPSSAPIAKASSVRPVFLILLPSQGTQNPVPRTRSCFSHASVVKVPKASAHQDPPCATPSRRPSRTPPGSLKTKSVSHPFANPRPCPGLPAQALLLPPVPRWLPLRKEVIQPPLPIRLPCYDFTPIANPTFGGWPPCGLPPRLRVLPTLVV